MFGVATDYLALIEAMPPGAVTILNKVDWETYDHLVKDLMGRREVRLSYDNGRLEIMALSMDHEIPAKLLPHLILVLAQACGLNFLSVGSSTLRKRPKAKGTEPDDCFYFNEFEKISGKSTIDLSVDPPPDLAFEVDITSPSLNKFPIYAEIGVPELWRFTESGIIFYLLVGSDYVETPNSGLFPFLSSDALLKFLRRGEEKGVVVMVSEFAEWVRANRK